MPPLGFPISRLCGRALVRLEFICGRAHLQGIDHRQGDRAMFQPAGSLLPLPKWALRTAKPDSELQFYGPVPSAISRWLLLMFWPLAVLMACLAWWLN
jgi:hypothetical protein